MFSSGESFDRTVMKSHTIADDAANSKNGLGDRTSHERLKRRVWCGGRFVHGEGLEIRLKTPREGYSGETNGRMKTDLFGRNAGCNDRKNKFLSSSVVTKLFVGRRERVWTRNFIFFLAISIHKYFVLLNTASYARLNRGRKSFLKIIFTHQN